MSESIRTLANLLPRAKPREKSGHSLQEVRQHGNFPVEHARGLGVSTTSDVFTIAHISKKIDGTVSSTNFVQVFAPPQAIELA